MPFFFCSFSFFFSSWYALLNCWSTPRMPPVCGRGVELLLATVDSWCCVRWAVASSVVSCCTFLFASDSCSPQLSNSLLIVCFSSSLFCKNVWLVRYWFCLARLVPAPGWFVPETASASPSFLSSSFFLPCLYVGDVRGCYHFLALMALGSAGLFAFLCWLYVSFVWNYAYPLLFQVQCTAPYENIYDCRADCQKITITVA